MQSLDCMAPMLEPPKSTPDTRNPKLETRNPKPESTRRCAECFQISGFGDSGFGFVVCGLWFVVWGVGLGSIVWGLGLGFGVGFRIKEEPDVRRC